MALPILNEAPHYELTVPSTQEVIQFRPFLVKEQKILLIAFETKDKKQILNAILDTIKACCPDINERKLTSFDVDYVFTQIRTKAVGETTIIIAKCSDESCKHPNEVTVNLDNAELENTNISNTVVINDEISIKMRWPSYSEIVNNNIITGDNHSNTEIIYETIKMSIDSILTKDELISLKDESAEEIERFINSLTTSQFNEINKFISNAPTLKHNLKFTCTSCGKENNTVLEGIEDFFS